MRRIWKIAKNQASQLCEENQQVLITSLKLTGFFWTPTSMAKEILRSEAKKVNLQSDTLTSSGPEDILLQRPLVQDCEELKSVSHLYNRKEYQCPVICARQACHLLGTRKRQT